MSDASIIQDVGHEDRCEPTDCRQACDCERARIDARYVRGSRMVIDASVIHRTSNGWCPMFIDARGAALRKAA